MQARTHALLTLSPSLCPFADCSLPQRIVRWWTAGAEQPRRGYMGHLANIASLVTRFNLAALSGVDPVCVCVCVFVFVCARVSE